MITVSRYSSDEILCLIGLDKKPIKLHGHTVKASSPRLECFRLNQKCAECSRRGTVFLLQSHVMEPPHLNFYHVTDTGKMVLMTKDHIIPVSRGGSNTMQNLQTMCRECNVRKGNSIPGDKK